MTFFLCLYSLFFLLNRRLRFCDMVYYLSHPVSVSDYIFSMSWHFYWVAPRICVLSSRLVPTYRYSLHFFYTWRCIRGCHWLNSDVLQVTCHHVSTSSSDILHSLVLFSHFSTQYPIFFSQNELHFH